MKNIEEIFNKIHFGKWEEVMPTIPDSSTDIIITSPPYNVSLGQNKFRDKDKGYDTYEDNMPYEDYLNWMDRLYTECYRVLKPGGRICINIGDGSNGSISPNCGEKLDRDINASKNILEQGLNNLNSGCGIQSEDKQKRVEALPSEVSLRNTKPKHL